MKIDNNIKRDNLERMTYFKSFRETEEALPTIKAKYAFHVVICNYGFHAKEIEESFAEPPLSELGLDDNEKQFVRVGFNGCYKQIDKSAERILNGHKGGRPPVDDKLMEVDNRLIERNEMLSRTR